MANLTELYEFKIADTFYRQTSGQRAVTWELQTYAPYALERDNVYSSPDVNKSGLRIRMGYNNPVAVLLADNPTLLGQVKIWSKATKAANPIVLWVGRTAALTYKTEKMELTCESILTSLKRQGNHLRYQMVCPHPLYSDACGVNRNTYVEYTKIASITDRSTLVLQDIKTEANYYTGGYVVIGGVDYRMILTHSGKTITITPQIGGNVKPGAEVIIYPGCNYSTGHCQNKYGNLLNFGGYPYIPDRNPFSDLGNSLTGM